MAFFGNELFFQVKEDWRTNGPPREAWSSSGALWRLLEKYHRQDLKGTGIGELALYSTLGGRGGSNFDYSFRFGGTPTGVRFEIPIGAHWELARWSQFELEMVTSQSTVAGVSALQSRMVHTGTRGNKALSALMHSDGTGLVAKGDGAWTIAANVITFKNSLDADKFEVGDRLIFASEAAKAAAAAGQQPATRAFASADPSAVNGYLEVTGVQRSQGRVTVNVNATAAVPTVANTDWIGFAASFGGDGAQGRRPVQGLRTYVPITATDAAKPLFGVTRSTDVDRLAGWREEINGTESPWAIIGLLAKLAKRAIGEPQEGDSWVISVGTQEMVRLIAQMEAMSIFAGCSRTLSSGMDYKLALCLGLDSVSVQLPGFGTIDVIVDQYQTDSALTAAEDRTYYMFNLRDMYFGTTSLGLNWRNYDGQGSNTHEIAGTQEIYGQWGTYGNLYLLNPGRVMLASPRAYD